MNEQLQQSLASILEKTVSGVEAGAAFLQAEIPDVIHQLLIWKMAESLIFFVFGVVLLVTVSLVIKSQVKKVKIDESSGYYQNTKSNMVYDSDGDVHPGVVAFIAGAGVSILVAGALILDGKTALQIWLAPKIYLIEYAASLTK